MLLPSCCKSGEKSNRHVACTTLSSFLAQLLIATPPKHSGKSQLCYLPSVPALSDAIKKTTCAINGSVPSPPEQRRAEGTHITFVRIRVTSEVTAVRVQQVEGQRARFKQSSQKRSSQEQRWQKTKVSGKQETLTRAQMEKPTFYTSVTCPKTCGWGSRVKPQQHTTLLAGGKSPRPPLFWL